MLEPQSVLQPCTQYFFDQFVLRVAYSIWRWRVMVGKTDPGNEALDRHANHHIARRLVSTEYYVPDYKTWWWCRGTSLISLESFESIARHTALCASQARARFDWLLAEWQLLVDRPAMITESLVRQRASELYEARREFSDLQNWELGKIAASENYVISESACA